MPTTVSLLWWNVRNLHDDVDQAGRHEIVRSTPDYRRDLREIADIIDRVVPAPDLVGCAEVENHGVMLDLAAQLARHPRRLDYRCDQHIESRDPRGIDVGALIRRVPGVTPLRMLPVWPDSVEAVRPLIRIDLLVEGLLPLTVVLNHGKSRRSGASTVEDAMPGSHLRLACGQALRRLAEECGAAGTALVVMGDFNDEPTSHSQIAGAGAAIGRPLAGSAEPGRLYNLSPEGLADARGTCTHMGNWLLFDQVLVNGVLLDPPPGGLRIEGRAHILADDPLIHRGEPNRWYSDHLPIQLILRRD